MKKNVLFLFYLLTFSAAIAQPVEKMYKVVVAPDHFDWTYKTGENVKFTVSVLQNGNLLKNARIRYEIGPEKMEATKKETISLPTGMITLDGGTMKTGGFLRCIVFAEIDGKEYKSLGTAGFDPLSIQPTVENPTDFDTFWQTAKTDLAKIPLDAKMTLLPERCTETVNVYHVNIQNFRVGARL
jgi:hypothetical protein